MKKRQSQALELLRSDRTFPDIARLRPAPGELAGHQARFRQFVREAPDLDLETQTVAYNMTMGVHISLGQTTIWGASNHADDCKARAQAAEPGQTWQQLGAELPPLDRPLGHFPPDERNHLLFTALRRVLRSCKETTEKMQDIHGIVVPLATADKWANADRVRTHRALTSLRTYLGLNPDVTDVVQARMESGISGNYLTDTEIRQCMKEQERIRLFTQAVARQAAGLPYLDTASFAPSSSAAEARTAASPSGWEPLPDWADDPYKPEEHETLDQLRLRLWPDDFMQ